MRKGLLGPGLAIAAAWLLALAPAAAAMRITFKGSGSFSYHLEANYDDDETTDISSGFKWTTVFAPAAEPGTKFAPASYQIGADPLPISPSGQPSYAKSSGQGTFSYEFVNRDNTGTVQQQVGPCTGGLTPSFAGAEVDVSGSTLTILPIAPGSDGFTPSAGSCQPNGSPFDWYGTLSGEGVGQNVPGDLQGDFPVTRITLSKHDLQQVLVRRAVESTLDAPPPLPGDCGTPDASSENCRLSYAWQGTVTVCNSVADPAKLKTVSAPMQAELEALFAKLDSENACYVLSSAFRSRSTQQDLYDRWHAIADGHANDPGICNQLKAAGLAQCPHGQNADGTARGGPAKPGTSRHEVHEAADLNVVWPQNGYSPSTSLLRAAAHAVGLCGPPASDPVHVELKYKSKGDKQPSCHFD